MNEPLLQVSQLSVAADNIVLLDDIGFTLQAGQSLGIVGESGSGKSMTAWAIMGLLPQGVRATKGIISLAGSNLLNLNHARMEKIRGHKIAMIFQDPQAALNPVRSIAAQMDDAIKAHFDEPKKRRRERMRHYLREAELNEPERVLSAYPFQLSGGMMQRVLIAMALSLEPELLIADEPTTALDATIQAQITELLQKIQQKSKMALIVISHHFGVVSRLCEHILVMYGGRVAEYASTKSLMARPRHPYTEALLKARPTLKQSDAMLYSIPGTPPPAGAYSDRCKFEPRCPKRIHRCAQEVPQLLETPQGSVACFLYEDE